MSPELLSPYVLLLQVVQSMMKGGDSAAGYYDDEGNYVGASLIAWSLRLAGRSFRVTAFCCLQYCMPWSHRVWVVDLAVLKR